MSPHSFVLLRRKTVGEHSTRDRGTHVTGRMQPNNLRFRHTARQVRQVLWRTLRSVSCGVM